MNWKTFTPTSATLFLLCCLGLSAGQPVQAEPVYRCQGPAGRVVFQGWPCSAGARTASTNVQRPAALPPFTKDPNAPELALLYDHRGAPDGLSIRQMEQLIYNAATAWNTGCNINLHYVGRIDKDVILTAGDKIIRWNRNLEQDTALGKSGAAERASEDLGVELNPEAIARAPDSLLRAITHGIGHVIGLPHIHEDSLAVMSYLVPRAIAVQARPTPSDYATCNLTIQNKYGIAFTLPVGAVPAKMTDSEALHRLNGGT